MIHEITLQLPGLSARLEGLRIAHFSDLHACRRRSRHRKIADALTDIDCDLLALTGDYMTHPGDEQVSLEVMQAILASAKPRLATIGVFGNHDTEELRQLYKTLEVHWLNDNTWCSSDDSLDVIGFNMSRDDQPDVVQAVGGLSEDDAQFSNRVLDDAAEAAGPHDGRDRALRLVLGHSPMMLPQAAAINADLLLSGHTHGGQIRMPWWPRPIPLYNAVKLPLRFTSGLLQLGSTRCAISRGLGEVLLPIRVCCRPQLPVYTLRCADHEVEELHMSTIRNIQPW